MKKNFFLFLCTVLCADVALSHPTPPDCIENLYQINNKTIDPYEITLSPFASEVLQLTSGLICCIAILCCLQSSNQKEKIKALKKERKRILKEEETKILERNKKLEEALINKEKLFEEKKAKRFSDTINSFASFPLDNLNDIEKLYNENKETYEHFQKFLSDEMKKRENEERINSKNKKFVLKYFDSYIDETIGDMQIFLKKKKEFFTIKLDAESPKISMNEKKEIEERVEKKNIKMKKIEEALCEKMRFSQEKIIEMVNILYKKRKESEEKEKQILQKYNLFDEFECKKQNNKETEQHLFLSRVRKEDEKKVKKKLEKIKKFNEQEKKCNEEIIKKIESSWKEKNDEFSKKMEALFICKLNEKETELKKPYFLEKEKQKIKRNQDNWFKKRELFLNYVFSSNYTLESLKNHLKKQRKNLKKALNTNDSDFIDEMNSIIIKNDVFLCDIDNKYWKCINAQDIWEKTFHTICEEGKEVRYQKAWIIEEEKKQKKSEEERIHKGEKSLFLSEIKEANEKDEEEEPIINERISNMLMEENKKNINYLVEQTGNEEKKNERDVSKKSVYTNENFSFFETTTD